MCSHSHQCHKSTTYDIVRGNTSGTAVPHQMSRSKHADRNTTPASSERHSGGASIASGSIAVPIDVVQGQCEPVVPARHGLRRRAIFVQRVVQWDMDINRHRLHSGNSRSRGRLHGLEIHKHSIHGPRTLSRGGQHVSEERG